MKKMTCSRCTAGDRATKGDTCPDQMTDSFQAHKDVMQLLSQARAMRSALVNRLHCTDVCCERVSCPHTPSTFWISFRETESPPLLR